MTSAGRTRSRAAKFPSAAPGRGNITRHHQAGADFAFVRRAGIDELHITVQPLPGEAPAMMLLRLDAIIRTHYAFVTRMEVFGAVREHADFMRTLRGLMGEPHWPIMWINGPGFFGNPVAGVHVMAIVGADVRPVYSQGRVVGATFHDSYARHCVLGNVLPNKTEDTRAAQARQVFENIALALDRVDMEPRHLVRTWMCLDNAGSWYADFNRQRTQIFKEWQLSARGVPASTAVGAGNCQGAAIVAGAWSTVPFNGGASVSEVVSPLQCSPGRYGSSFARAMEWTAPDYRRLTLSGTAAVEHNGSSVQDDDIRCQVDLTMDVVEAILDSRGVGFGHVTRATAYIRDPEYADCLEEWFERTGAAWFPAIATQTQLCRDELLFQIELDTIALA